MVEKPCRSAKSVDLISDGWKLNKSPHNYGVYIQLIPSRNALTWIFLIFHWTSNATVRIINYMRVVKIPIVIRFYIEWISIFILYPFRVYSCRFLSCFSWLKNQCQSVKIRGSIYGWYLTADSWKNRHFSSALIYPAFQVDCFISEKGVLSVNLTTNC